MEPEVKERNVSLFKRILILSALVLLLAVAFVTPVRVLMQDISRESRIKNLEKAEGADLTRAGDFANIYEETFETRDMTAKLLDYRSSGGCARVGTTMYQQ